jgi:hypothetical protein
MIGYQTALLRRPVNVWKGNGSQKNRILNEQYTW